MNTTKNVLLLGFKIFSRTNVCFNNYFKISVLSLDKRFKTTGLLIVVIRNSLKTYDEHILHILEVKFWICIPKLQITSFRGILLPEINWIFNPLLTRGQSLLLGIFRQTYYNFFHNLKVISIEKLNARIILTFILYYNKNI